jgi:hypothetical protein
MPTDRVSPARPLTHSEATSKARRFQFEEFYRKREEKRIASGEPSPEELSSRSLKEIQALEQALNDGPEQSPAGEALPELRGHDALD